MRLGWVRGQVVLNTAVPSLRGNRLVVVEPITAENLASQDLAAESVLGGGKALVAVDHLGAAEGQMVAFTEGREACNPFWPEHVPVDAYCALIVKSVSFHPPTSTDRGKR